jgi:hypothetical protein
MTNTKTSAAARSSTALAAPAKETRAKAAKSSVPLAAKSAAKPAHKLARPAVAPAAPKVKHKLIRDSFTIPKSEYSVLESLKLRALALARPTKKSELLRAGIAALSAMSDKQFLAAVSSIPSLKTGRPKTDAPAQSAGM